MVNKVNIAVILSVYKNSKLSELKRAILSIDKQEKIILDLLICFDGYVINEIKDFLENFKSKKAINKIITFKNKSNKGLAYSLNKLILYKFSNYKFFVRHDCDDYSHKNRVSLLVDFLNKNNDIDIVGSGSKSFFKSDKNKFYLNTYPTHHKDIAKAFSYSAPISHGTVVFKNTFFIKAGLYDAKLSNLLEDQKLWYSGLISGCKFASIKDILYFVSTDNYQYKRRSNISLIFNLFFIRIKYIFKSDISLIYLAFAFGEFLVRIALSILLYLNLNKFLFIILLKYKSRKN